MSIRSHLAAVGSGLALVAAFAPASRAGETLSLIEQACAQTGSQDSRSYLDCVESTARVILTSTGTARPYLVEIISGEPLDTLSDQMADAS